MAASKEQLVALKKQLEEAQRLRDQAEKAKVEAEKPKPKLRGREMKPSSTVMTSAWLRLRMP